MFDVMGMRKRIIGKNKHQDKFSKIYKQESIE